ncbi:palmitoyltransferase ZDHHC20-B-like isoform X1 [Dermacentor andersoni]|uniref:palmitoyltransferase ZDHHC20-B-like isoform X1 n=2 Tax=Dermacentor andersoni TaxID=34620 RepID=UPI002417D84F|nr:palmitoyltransferase ZDHHC20-B-like [Dermacentor andersoni]
MNATNRRMIEESKTYEEKKELLEGLGANRGILTRAADGSVRYCEPCGLVKPDRSHHCSSCRRCILKMDHHCPWLNNCVGFSTYKFFLLTLFYVVVLASYTLVSVSSYALDTSSAMGLPTEVLVHTGFLLLAGTALTVLIGGFFIVHLRILGRNETTLEAMRPFLFVEPLDSFDLGVRRNIVEVFGSSVILWPFPVHSTPGDGVCFPTKLYPDPETAILPLLRQRTRQLALALPGRDLPVVAPSMETAFVNLMPPSDAARVSAIDHAQRKTASTTLPERDIYATAAETSGMSLSSSSEQYRSARTVSVLTGGTGVATTTPPTGMLSAAVRTRPPGQQPAAAPGRESPVRAALGRPSLMTTTSQSSFPTLSTR